jgi:hypothetical protein
MNTKQANATTLMRVMLVKREAYRVAEGQRGLRVRSGRAWVTLNGSDLVLRRGEEIVIASKGDFAVVSALGCVPLVIELLGDTPQPPAVDPRPVVNAL